MLVNSILLNIDAWHSVTLTNIVQPEKIDEQHLRFLVNSHSKTAREFLYLELGTIPIRYILVARRINFLQTILKRDKEELTKRILDVQWILVD